MATSQIVFLTMTILDEIYNENRRWQFVNYGKKSSINKNVARH